MHVALLVLGILSITVSPLGQAVASAAATPPDQPASGPGGRDYRYDAVQRRRVGESPAGAYVFTPDGREAPHASWPLIVFVHGFTAVNPDVYGGWIEHLVRRGAIVVYPDYQPANPLAGTPDAYLGDMMAGVRAALLMLDRQGDGPVVVVGHSLGAILAVNYAALAADAGFPAPDVLMAVEPGGCRTCGAEAGFGVPLPASPAFPSELRASVVVGNDDTVVGEENARWIWGLLGDRPATRSAYVRVRTDRHGEPALVADHQIPLTKAPGTLNALDWNGLWRLLDVQIACATPPAACGSVFGPNDATDMGRWSDGEPVAPLEIIERATASRSSSDSKWSESASSQWMNEQHASAAVTVARPAAMTSSEASRVRAVARRKNVLSLLKTCSMGAKSGEEGGGMRTEHPAASINGCALGLVCRL